MSVSFQMMDPLGDSGQIPIELGTLRHHEAVKRERGPKEIEGESGEEVEKHRARVAVSMPRTSLTASHCADRRHRPITSIRRATRFRRIERVGRPASRRALPQRSARERSRALERVGQVSEYDL